MPTGPFLYADQLIDTLHKKAENRCASPHDFSCIMQSDSTQQKGACSGGCLIYRMAFLPCGCHALACSNDKYMLGKPVACAGHVSMAY